MNHHLDKEKIARSFLRGQSTYDQHAEVQHRISRKLIDMLDDYPDMSFERVLEIGCYTGAMTEVFLARYQVGKLYLNDLVPEFYDCVVERLGDKTSTDFEPLIGDIESLKIPGSLDLVLSSSTFQWLEDLQGFFNRISAALKRKGYLAFSIFGPGTLNEFKQLIGIGLGYIALGNVLGLLEADFVLEFVDTEEHTLFFNSPRDVLRHVQATGVGGVGDFRWTGKKLREFETEYRDRYGTSDGIPVTYVASYVIARKK